MPVTIYKAEYHVKDVGEATKRRMLALMKQLEKQAKAVEDRLDRMAASSRKGSDKVTKAWVQAEVGAGKAGDAAKKAGDDAAKGAKGLGSFVTKLGALAAAASLAVLAVIGKQILEIGARFEQLGVQLDTVFGAEGTEVFERLRESAAKTPFTLEAITESAIRLKAVGLEPTERLLRAIGDTSAAFGKDITQFSQAVVQATVGEMEMLKQFGIIARQQGDIVRFTFKGVTTEVGKNADEIVEFLTRLGETEFSGAMEKQALTLTGRLSTLQDGAAELASGLFELGAGGVAKDVVSGLTDILGSINSVIGALRDQQTAIASGRALIDEYSASLDGATGSQDDFGAAVTRTARQIAAQAQFQAIASQISDVSAEVERLQEMVDRGGEHRVGAVNVKALEDGRAKLEELRAELADFTFAVSKANREGTLDELLDTGEGDPAETVRLTAKAVKALALDEERLAEAHQLLKEEGVDLFFELAKAAKAYRDVLDDLSRLQELPSVFAGDFGAGSLLSPLETGSGFTNVSGGTVTGLVRTELDDVADVFGEDMSDIALSFGVQLADSVRSGNVDEAFRSIAQGMGGQIGKALAKEISGRLGGGRGVSALGGIAGAAVSSGAFDVSLGGGQASEILSVIGGVVGAAFGGPFGAAIGSFVGDALGSLDVFQSGGNDFITAMELQGGQLSAVADKAEGSTVFRDAGQKLGDQVAGLVNTILAAVGGELVEAANIRLKTRITDEGTSFRVLEGETTIVDTMDQAAAVAATVLAVLQRGVVEGLGDSVREALQSGSFDTVEGLLSGLNFAEGIDAALRSPWENFVATVGAGTRSTLASAQDLGISTDRVVEAERRRIQSLIDEEAALIRSIGGVQSFLGQWQDLLRAIEVAGPEGVAELEAQLLAAGEAARAQAQEAQEAGQLTAESFDDILEVMGRFGDRAEGFRERFEELVSSGASAEEVIAELVASLEGVSAGEVEAALDAFRNAADANFLGQLAGVADAVGETALAENLRAQALALSTEATFLSSQITIAQAHAEGILSDARHAAFQATISQIQEAVDAAGGFAAAVGTGRRSGGGGAKARREAREAEASRRADAVAAASESMADVLQRVQDQLDGVTSEERRRLDLLALWEAQLREGLITQEEYTAGLAKLAELQAFLAEQAAEAATQLAVDATEAWAELGRTLEESDLDTQLRQFLESAVEDMAAGGAGIGPVFATQVEEWFQDALEGADTPEAFREILNSWESFLGSDLPPHVREALQASGIGAQIAAGIAASVRAQDVAAFIAGARGVNLPDVLANAATGSGGGRGGGGGSVAGAASSTSDELERLRDELESFLDASERGQLEPLERQLLDIFDEFARLGSILQTVDASTEEWGRTASDLAAELGDVWGAARDSIDDIINKIEGRGALPADTFVQSRAEFESIIAALPADLSTLTPDELNAAAAAAEALLSGAEGLFGEGFGASVVDRTLLPILEELKDLAPSEEDLLLLALEHLQSQAALQLEETRRGFSSSGAIATAVDAAAGVDGEASLLELVEIARVSGVLADTMGFIGDLTVQEVDELQATVAHLLSLASLSEAQRRELLGIQELLQRDDELDALLGLLENPLRVDAQELEDALALVNVLLGQAGNLAPDQLLELQAVVAGLLDLKGLSESQRAALVAAQESLGTVAAETGATTAAVTAGTDAADDRAAQQGTQLGNLVAIRQSLGPGNLNGTALSINRKLAVMSSALGSRGHLNANLTRISNRIGSGDVNAELRKISRSLSKIERSGALSGAGGL